MATILIVDDDTVNLSSLARVLSQAGYHTQTTRTGTEAMSHLQRLSVDLLLIDTATDQFDAMGCLQVAKSLDPDLATVVLTRRPTVESAVAAFRHGANDYLLKPVRNEDILQAVEDALSERNRSIQLKELEKIATQMAGLLNGNGNGKTQTSDIIRCANLELHPASFKSYIDGEDIHLTPTEFRLLLALCQQPGQAIEYVQLVQAACGYTCSRYEAQNIIGAHVRNLRRKLEAEPDEILYVEAVRGVGYRIIAPNVG
jgi:DNA-binding response OmpR family regulator